MHLATILPVLIGFAAAVPYNDVANSPEAAIAPARWFGKRDDKKDDKKATPTNPGCKSTPATVCTSQPTGYGPTASPDTVPNFKNHGQITKMAAQAETPKGYTQVFQNEDGSANADKYITYFNFQSYDTNSCAAKCSQTSGCTAFNIYLERNPTLSTDPLCCPNPPSMTNIKCALWGSALDKKSATNKGQWRNSFEVVMGGSNGYNRVGGTSSSSPASTSGKSPSSKSSSTTSSSATSKFASTTSPGTSSKSSSATASSTTSSAKPASTSSPSSSSSTKVGSTTSSDATSSPKSATSDKAQSSSTVSSATTSAATPSPKDATSDKNQESSSSSSAEPSIATPDKSPAALKDAQVNSASSSASPPTIDMSVTPTTTADTNAQSSSAPTTSSEMSSSMDDSSPSGPKTYLSNTDEVQPITGTEPGSPVTATAETSSASTGCSTPVATPAITFNLNKTTIANEKIFMYGSIDQLGNWQVAKSYPLTSYILKDGSNRTNWYGTIDVAAGTYFEYKYFQRNPDYSISWANPPNMRYTVPTGCEELIVQSDQWPGTEDGTS